jgi:hypothetical protein
MSARFYYTDRNGEITDVGAKQYKLHESGALSFTNGSIFEPELVLVVAPGDWHDLTGGDDE